MRSIVSALVIAAGLATFGGAAQAAPAVPAGLTVQQEGIVLAQMTRMERRMMERRMMERRMERRVMRRDMERRMMRREIRRDMRRY
jgi:hypothetical protein